ncbi:MAG: HAMP domain-containing sensor histidine kinase [Deltaproteobacteria bacterium]|nr:HAMP domain-containing sensor histidine kinase [Deltaproteobacteria bacterium]
MLFFGKKSYDYEQLSKKFSSLLTKNISPDELYLGLLKCLTEAMHTESGTFVLREKDVYAVRQSLDGRSFSFRAEDCVNIIHWLKKNRGTLTRQQLLEESHFTPIRTAGLNFFTQFHAEACLPLFAGDDLLGFVMLGARKKSEAYSASSRTVLDWMGTQFSLGLQNALLKEQIRAQNLELGSVKNLKSQIVANLSHELRTPLTGVIGFSELLAEEIDGQLNDEQKRHVGQVLGNANRLMKILAALVDMAKLEAGNLSMHVQQFSLAPLVASLGDEIPLGGETAFKILLDTTTPRIYGDLTLVRQVFKHLLDNAAKYTPRGEVEVTAVKKGEMLEVCIADTGIGIAEEKLSQIFDGFYQVDGGLTREFQGAGIGLVLSKKLVELHGGRLWVKSAPGKGSRFYFTLPLKPIVIKYRELAA